MSAIPFNAWTERDDHRDGWYGRYSTPFGVKRVADPDRPRAALLFGSEAAALRAAVAGLCKDFNSIPALPSRGAKIHIPARRQADRFFKKSAR